MDNTISQPPGALILGPACVSARIVRSLERHGYRCETVENLPAVADPNASNAMRDLLSDFLGRQPPLSPGWAHCLHPGVSLWAERSELFQIAHELGFIVLGPSSKVVSLFSNKLNLLTEAEKLGISNLIVSSDPIYNVHEVERLLGTGAPLVLKSAHGGGESGIFVIHQPDDVETRLPLWIEQLRRNVGEVILFVERYLDGSRHVSLPFSRLQDGRFESFPAVDGSLQSRYRKTIEICPADFLDPETLETLVEWTRALSEHVGYVGVGSLEFMCDGERPYLVDGLCRLSATYGLWELVAGTDAVEWQLAALENRRELPARVPKREWTAGVALRIRCEDPVLQLPLPGVVHEVSEQREWKLPGASAQAEIGVQVGDDLVTKSSGLVGILFAGAHERKQAVSLARGILSELWIAGSLQTNERFLDELLLHPWVREGVYHSGYVDEEFVPSLRPEASWMTIAAQICREALGPVAVASRWTVSDQWIRDVEGTPPWLEVQRSEAGVSGRITVPDGRVLRASAWRLPGSGENARWMVRIGLWIVPVRHVRPTPKGNKDGRLKLRSLVPGRVHSLLFLRDAVVPAHSAICLVECQGTLVPHALPIHSILSEWKVKAEQTVTLGQDLALFTTN